MSKPRVFLLGLDGADDNTLGVALRFGRMPNLGRLVHESIRPLRSTPLPITPAAWTAAYTGYNPGKTGVLTFQRRIPNSYRGRLVTSADVGNLGFHTRLAEFGKVVVSVGFPMMSPPPQSRASAIVSGWDSNPKAALSNDQKIDALLADLGYRIDDEFSTDVRLLGEGVRTRFRILEALLRDRDWDCAMLYCGFIDGLGHRVGFGNAQTQDLLALVDQELGRFYSTLEDEPAFIVCSDHGFGNFSRSFSVMQWLEENGYLALRSKSFRNEGMIPGVEVMDLESGLIDWAATKAFCWESIGRFAAISLNLKGSYPRATVSPREAYDLAGEIIQKVLAIRDPQTGEKLVVSAWRREEILWGEFARELPEIFIETAPDTTAFIGKRRAVNGGYELEPGIVHRGSFNSHLADGVWGSSFPVDSSTLRIEDVAPTVYALLDLEIPDDIDGENRSGKTVVNTSHSGVDASPYSHEEEAIVRKRLEDLGYL